MSIYTKCKTKITDKETLIKALQDMGFAANQIKNHMQAKPLQGYENRNRKETAEIIIPKQFVGGAANDIGFKEQEDGTYTAVISSYDTRSGHAPTSKYNKNKSYNSAWLDKLAQRYARHKLGEEIEAQGFYIEEETEENGEIFLEVSAMIGG